MLDTELLYIFGVSVIGVASIAYILFGPSPSFPKHKNDGKITICGLQNVKNNCFINSILQSIASSDSMITWLNYANESSNRKAKLIKIIDCLINKMNKNGNLNEILTPHNVLNALKEHRWIFSHEEQDAYELFNVLTSTLEKELNQFQILFYINNIFHDKNTCNYNTEKPLNASLRIVGKTEIVKSGNNSLPTRGVLANHLICRNCHYKYPLRLDAFDSISLNLPANALGSSILIENCLNKFVSTELIEDFMCETCSQKSAFDKKIEFIKLPKLLCFHIQRLVWLMNGNLVKRFDHVMFPEYLEMDPYTYKYRDISFDDKLPYRKIDLIGDLSCKEVLDKILPLNKNQENEPKPIRYKYALNSVIVHLGSTSSGHFICYRRWFDTLTRRFKWYYTSDLVIREANRKEVLSSSAYMLFYERINDRVM